MNLTQLNSLAVLYKENRTQEAFNDLYKEARQLFLKIHIAMTVRGRRGDEHDAEESFDEAMMSLASRDDVENFGEALSAALRIKRVFLERGNVRREKRYQITADQTEEQEDGSHTAMCVLTDGVSAEEIAIDNLTQKKDAQKRQLLSSLCDPAKVDNDTTLIVSNGLQRKSGGAPEHKSINALAKALGMHPEFVKRKLRKLSRGYDANRFGDVNEYLAV
ncbi:sigma-70 family RNA polymerase sigma factor [Paenibacillus sp. UASWS1643]|uniref:sigma-70 family RNA polymerase sigma factor n=1 Tax=Paenibacillus sp. UASWS1643 TaxID=2580422 RepID=UPI0012391029|nr:sigma-70 family RNA polymerase sigma factor [Paenibacillus sp. UASWS1643]KAA8750186.1 sigma-70 family RNA polymerase sigma factor [Paenibacillus sp. UASWS1643]